MVKKVAAIALTCLFSLTLLGNLVPHAPPSNSGAGYQTGRVIGFVLVLGGLFFSARWVVVLFGNKQT